MNSTSPKPAATLVGDLFIDHDDVVEEALALMVENHVTALPVLGPGGEVVGSVSYSEILRRLPEASQRILAHVPQGSREDPCSFPPFRRKTSDAVS